MAITVEEICSKTEKSLKNENFNKKMKLFFLLIFVTIISLSLEQKKFIKISLLFDGQFS